MPTSNNPQHKAKPYLDQDGNTYGEFDTDKKYPFPATWMGQVVVTQFNVFAAPSGQQMVDEGTRRTMPYEPATFANLVETQGFGDMQYFILHDPR